MTKSMRDRVEYLENEVESLNKKIDELTHDLFAFSVIMVKFLESPKVKEVFGKDDLTAALKEEPQ